MRGDRLKDLRQGRRLTQEQMASKLDVPRTTYAAYEQNKREPDDAMKIKIADYFGVTVDYLVGNSSSRSSSAPNWANDQDIHDLKAFLDANEDAMTYEGEHLTDEERKQLRVAEETIFWRHRKQARK
ncbi:helix-turn-helix domain-containing protein [Lentilactobacillus buchneri]|uniref:helix-turn-helix domain-containing protein n=1 Tax=Lentilactobacillus buchneri TaxID=1581 RepID=UPI0011EC7DF4|nr:helix-turn-helix transcriptional regulator [Lentilactobacillus buchneri]